MFVTGKEGEGGGKEKLEKLEERENEYLMRLQRGNGGPFSLK